jgi:short-subunit dehydrogenase
MELAGRHVVVTGGSRGMGAALGGAFAAAGATVTLVARTEDDLKRIAADTGSRYVVADLLEPAGLIERIEATAPVDILVNNAGVASPAELVDLPPGVLSSLYRLNALAPAELARQVLPGMLRRGSGRLVFISSLSAQVALPGLTAYSATKAAVSQLAEGLRRDLARTGVGVTNVELGPVATDMYEEIEAHPPTVKAFERLVRLGVLRKLTPQEAADAVVHACRADRGHVIRPRRAVVQAGGSHLPQWMINRVV